MCHVFSIKPFSFQYFLETLLSRAQFSIFILLCAGLHFADHPHLFLSSCNLPKRMHGIFGCSFKKQHGKVLGYTLKWAGEYQPFRYFIWFVSNGVLFIIHFYKEKDNHGNRACLNLFRVYFTSEMRLKIFFKINISQSVYLCSESCSKKKKKGNWRENSFCFGDRDKETSVCCEKSGHLTALSVFLLASFQSHRVLWCHPTSKQAKGNFLVW